jgi:maltooligosyltrehalose trehalohydrolase
LYFSIGINVENTSKPACNFKPLYVKIGSNVLSNGGKEFTIWAPLKNKMFLHVVAPFDKKIEMQKDNCGYFHATLETDALCRYYLMPEGEHEFPDPASQFQPEGVHGPSEVVDHSSYTWNDKDWRGIPFSELILYELHTGTFTPEGTFEAIINKLDHLVETGVNAIELMPVGQFPGSRNWGYDGVFPYAVQNSYGGPIGLKKLVDACHQKGIAVFLDVVYNHLGPEGNYLEQFGPYFTDHYKTPWGKAINYDGRWADGVRDFFSENAVYFFEHFHVDGLRLDAIHQVYDTGAVHIWELMHDKIRKLEKKLGRSLYTIAESDLNSPRVVKPPELGGFGFTAQWLDDFHHALYALIDKEGKKLYFDFGRLDQLTKAYKDGFVHSGEYVTFRKKKFGASSAGISGDRFVTFTDNHDQAGNRATGSCLSSILPFEKIKMASAAYLLSPYIPMLLMGEEYGDDSPFLYFISHGDEELVKLVREGRKKEFEHLGWDAEPPDPCVEDTFQRSKLHWEKLSEEKNRLIHDWYKELIHLRKKCAPLQNFNKSDVWVNAHQDMLELHRRSAAHDQQLVCVFNFSETNAASFTLPSSSSPWKKIIDANDKRWQMRQHNTYSCPCKTEPGEKITIPHLTVVAYAN